MIDANQTYNGKLEQFVDDQICPKLPAEFQKSCISYVHKVCVYGGRGWREALFVCVYLTVYVCVPSSLFPRSFSLPQSLPPTLSHSFSFSTLSLSQLFPPPPSRSPSLISIPASLSLPLSQELPEAWKVLINQLLDPIQAYMLHTCCIHSAYMLHAFCIHSGFTHF